MKKRLLSFRPTCACIAMRLCEFGTIYDLWERVVFASAYQQPKEETQNDRLWGCARPNQACNCLQIPAGVGAVNCPLDQISRAKRRDLELVKRLPDYLSKPFGYMCRQAQIHTRACSPHFQAFSTSCSISSGWIEFTNQKKQNHVCQTSFCSVAFHLAPCWPYPMFFQDYLLSYFSA